MIYAIGKHLVRAILHLYFGFSVSGEENVQDGPILVCGNHQSNWDRRWWAVPCRRKPASWQKKSFLKTNLLAASFPVWVRFPLSAPEATRAPYASF